MSTVYVGTGDQQLDTVLVAVLKRHWIRAMPLNEYHPLHIKTASVIIFIVDWERLDEDSRRCLLKMEEKYGARLMDISGRLAARSGRISCVLPFSWLWLVRALKEDVKLASG